MREAATSYGWRAALAVPPGSAWRAGLLACASGLLVAAGVPAVASAAPLVALACPGLCTAVDDTGHEVTFNPDVPGAPSAALTVIDRDGVPSAIALRVHDAVHRGRPSGARPPSTREGSPDAAPMTQGVARFDRDAVAPVAVHGRRVGRDGVGCRGARGTVDSGGGRARDHTLFAVRQIARVRLDHGAARCRVRHERASR